MEITLRLNAKFQPVHRFELEDALQEILEKTDRGEVTGGGTAQGITGDVEQMKNIKIDFLAGAGYTLENIEKTDYINCSPPLLFTD